MSRPSRPEKTEPTDDLDARLRRSSVVVSLLAMGLMIGGFVVGVLGGSVGPLPGSSVLPFSAYAHPAQAPLGLLAMSAGILLLVLLPTMRVFLALVLYARRRGFFNAVVALLVLLELLVSIRGGVG
jgi:uncharacterized membrane protein